MFLLSPIDSSRRMSMRHVSALVSPSNGLHRRRPITVNSPLNLTCGALAFYSPNWSPTDAYPIQVSHCVVFTSTDWLIDAFATLCRHDQRRSINPSGARLSHANATELWAATVWDNVGVLAQGSHAQTHVRDAAVEARGLLHIRPEWL